MLPHEFMLKREKQGMCQFLDDIFLIIFSNTYNKNKPAGAKKTETFSLAEPKKGKKFPFQK
jgi:hypothetical protein